MVLAWSAGGTDMTYSCPLVGLHAGSTALAGGPIRCHTRGFLVPGVGLHCLLLRLLPAPSFSLNGLAGHPLPWFPLRSFSCDRRHGPDGRRSRCDPLWNGRSDRNLSESPRLGYAVSRPRRLNGDAAGSSCLGSIDRCRGCCPVAARTGARWSTACRLSSSSLTVMHWPERGRIELSGTGHCR